VNYAVVGAGAVGGFYGARLAASGREVHFLYHSEYEAVRANGLRIESPLGDLSLAVKAYREPSEMPQVDVVIVALKATQGEVLASALPPLLHRGTRVLCLQNGLGNEERIAAMVGRERVIAGAAFICSERGEPGVVHHYGEGRLSIGPYFQEDAAGVLEAAHAVAADFKAAGVPCKVLSNGRSVKWGKLVWNIPYSGGSLYYGAVPTDRIAGNPEREDFVRRLMDEVMEAATRDGASIAPSLPEQNLSATRAMGAYKPSILVDFEKGRAVEADCIFAEPLRRGLAAGLAMPALEELLRGIRATLARSR
jgi:2-dehydropantoate 2-reductase